MENVHVLEPNHIEINPNPIMKDNTKILISVIKICTCVIYIDKD